MINWIDRLFTHIIVDIVFSGWAKEIIYAALREDALYPENCVESARGPKLLS